MEHSTIHPAKTVGDLRVYAQKFKQNQFCFEAKFIINGNENWLFLSNKSNTTFTNLSHVP